MEFIHKLQESYIILGILQKYVKNNDFVGKMTDEFYLNIPCTVLVIMKVAKYGTRQQYLSYSS